MCWSLPTLTVPAAHVPHHGACLPSVIGRYMCRRAKTMRVGRYRLTTHSNPKQIDSTPRQPVLSAPPPPTFFLSITCSVPNLSFLVSLLIFLSSSCVYDFVFGDISLYSLVWPVRIPPSSCSRQQFKHPSLTPSQQLPALSLHRITHSPQRKADSILGVHQNSIQPLRNCT